jgi:glycosyltransferase involved in cell wall biosynthesis
VARSICFYTDSREFGGAENSMLMLLEGLDRSRWAPSLLLGDGAGADQVAARAGALEVPVSRLRSLPLGLAGARGVPRRALALRRRRPTLFHAHVASPLSGKWSVAAAVLARLPTVVTVQLYPSYEIDRLSRLQLRGIAAGVDRYLAVSHDIAAKLEGVLGWPGEKIEVVHNSVALTPPQRDPRVLREELLGGRDLQLVLTIARLADQKGHSVLLRAATEVPGAAFVLAGDGPLRGALEEEARALGIADRVLFLGHRDDPSDLLAACDVFVLPSLFEGSSLAVLEAMAAARPVVSSAIGGTDELVVSGRSGLLVPPGDSDALAAALRLLLEDPALRAEIAAEAAARAEQGFSQAGMVRRVEAAYDQILDGGVA